MPKALKKNKSKWFDPKKMPKEDRIMIIELARQEDAEYRSSSLAHRRRFARMHAKLMGLAKWLQIDD